MLSLIHLCLALSCSLQNDKAVLVGRCQLFSFSSFRHAVLLSSVGSSYTLMEFLLLPKLLISNEIHCQSYRWLNCMLP